jgi:hypothetical protein
VLTSVANAALLRDEACSRPLPRRVAAIPELETRLRRKRRAVLVAAARRAADLNDPDMTNGSPESASLVVLLDALAEARAVADELEAVLEKARRAAPRKDAANPGLHESAPDLDEPAFECLSAPDLLARLQTSLDAYTGDVRVKRTALDAVVAGADVCLRVDSGDANEPKNKNGGGNLENLGDGFDMSRETMTTCVATWILSPSIDDAAREEFDAIVAQETK